MVQFPSKVLFSSDVMSVFSLVAGAYIFYWASYRFGAQAAHTWFEIRMVNQGQDKFRSMCGEAGFFYIQLLLLAVASSSNHHILLAGKAPACRKQ